MYSDQWQIFKGNYHCRQIGRYLLYNLIFFTIIAGVVCSAFSWMGSLRFKQGVFLADSHRRLFHMPVRVLLSVRLNTVFDLTVLKLGYYSQTGLYSVLYFFMWTNLTGGFSSDVSYILGYILSFKRCLLYQYLCSIPFGYIVSQREVQLAFFLQYFIFFYFGWGDSQMEIKFQSYNYAFPSSFISEICIRVYSGVCYWVIVIFLFFFFILRKLCIFNRIIKNTYIILLRIPPKCNNPQEKQIKASIITFILAFMKSQRFLS